MKCYRTIQDTEAATAALKVNGYSNKNVVTVIVLGFFGQLMNLWDNYLTYDAPLAILNHTTIEFDEHGERIRDEYETLVHTITLHFIGNPQEGQAAKTVSSNLDVPHT